MAAVVAAGEQGEAENERPPDQIPTPDPLQDQDRISPRKNERAAEGVDSQRV